MITALSPLFSRVATYADPKDILLQKDAWVRFSEAWPDTHQWVTCKVFRVAQEPVLVRYPISYTLPGNDFRDINLSNEVGGELVYPTNEGVLYQLAVGLKPGHYLVHTYIPVNRYVYALGQHTMRPDVTVENLRYLGAKTPADSPHTSPLWYLYAIKNMPSFILRLFVDDGVDFDKVTLELQINKCQLEEIPTPTQQQIDQALLLRWYTEFTGF